MARFGFIGGDYQSQSALADNEITDNFYVENNEGQGKSAASLYCTPGTKLYGTLPDTPTRGEIYTQGRLFAVGGSKFCEVSATGTISNVQAVVNDGLQAIMVAGNTQILIASGGAAYVFTLATNAWQQLTIAQIVGAVSFVAYCDGYFLALLAGTNQIQVSAVGNAASWDVTQIIVVSVFAGKVLSMIVNERLLTVLGERQAVTYYNAGQAPPQTPFAVVGGSGMDVGIGAPYSLTRLDNSIFWIDADERGGGIARRAAGAAGYTPARISTHAIETIWQSYATFSDAISYAIQNEGHSRWITYFPTANKTWAYDVATGLWGELSYWNAINAVRTAHRSRCHAYAFGKHIVGDWQTGKLYELSIKYLDDDGNPIRRVRRPPPISSENKYIRYHELILDVETGLGPIPPLLDGAGLPRAPQIMMRYSNDGNKTWSHEEIADCGQAGEYLTRVSFRRLGKARTRGFEIVVTDAIPWRFIDAYLRATPGFTSPAERVAAQLRKVS